MDQFWVFIPVFVLMIPIVAIIADAFKKGREREFLHTERLRAMETGQTETLEALTHGGDRKDRRGPGATFYGAIWTGIGGGLLLSTLVLRTMTQGSLGRDLEDLYTFATFLMIWAFPALGVGIGLLIYGFLNRKPKDQPE